MRRAPLLLGVVLLMSACSGLNAPGQRGEIPGSEGDRATREDDPNTPIGSDAPTQPAKQPDPIEGPVIEGMARVESIQLLTLETFPLQIHVVAQGQLADSCTQIGQIVQERDGNTFQVTITTIRPAEAICAEVLTPFLESIPLDVYGLPAGTYTVQVNGVTDSFTLDMDNILPDNGQSGTGSVRGPISDLASVSEVSVSTTGAFTVQVKIEGTVPDGCTGYLKITEERHGNTIRLTVGRAIPAGVECLAVITAFEQFYTIGDLADGTYRLEVNDFVTQFTIRGNSNSGGNTLTGLALVTDVKVTISLTYPSKVLLSIRGNLPDPCWSISTVTAERTGNTIRVRVEATRPDMICAQVIADFEQEYTLPFALEPGIYTLIVNNFSTTIRV